MALDLEIAALDAVPEAVRALYIPHGDKFRLDVTGIEDTTGLKKALDAERTTARELDKQSKQWKALGRTPEEFAAMIATQDKAETDRLAQAGEWDTLRKQMSDQHAATLKAESDKVAAAGHAVSKHIVDAQAIAAIAAAKGNTKLLMPFVRGALKAVEVNGDYTVQVLNDKGEPRVNAQGNFLSISDLVLEMKSDTSYGPLFESSGASGGGMSQSGAGAGLKTVSSSDKAAIGANLEAIAKGQIKVT